MHGFYPRNAWCSLKGTCSFKWTPGVKGLLASFFVYVLEIDISTKYFFVLVIYQRKMHGSQYKRSKFNSCPEMFCKFKCFDNFAKLTENTFAGVSFYCRCCRAETSLKRDPGTVFSCEFCEIFQNTFLIEDLRAPASLFADQIYLKDLIYSA